MKKNILIIALTFLSLNTFSQTTLNKAVDFVAADIYGDTLNLFKILDEGKYVYINFFRVNCSIDEEHVGQSEAAFNYFGCNGGDVVFLGVNTGNNNTEVEDYVDANSITYPVISGINGDEVLTIFEDYDIRASPTFILIAPGDSILEQNIWPVETSQQIISVLENQGLTETTCIVGIDEVTNNENILRIFPNPATDKIQITAELGDFNNAALRMFNLVGKEVLYQKIEVANPTLSIQGFSAGIYFITLLDNNQPISTKKIVVKR